MPHPQKNPPKRWKYCPTCKGITKFQYNRVSGHSHCKICGQSFYVPRMNEEGERKLRKQIRAAWANFDTDEWKRTDHEFVKRAKPGWLVAEEKENAKSK